MFYTRQLDMDTQICNQGFIPCKYVHSIKHTCTVRQIYNIQSLPFEQTHTSILESLLSCLGSITKEILQLPSQSYRPIWSIHLKGDTGRFELRFLMFYLISVFTIFDEYLQCDSYCQLSWTCLPFRNT